MKTRFSIFVSFCVCAGTAWCQPSDFSSTLQERLNRYHQASVSLNVYLTLNQDRYVAGDTVFYKAHLFTADDNRAVNGRQFLTVHLIDHDGTSLDEARILLTDGTGFNQLLIPPSAAPGVYRLIAYHDAMKHNPSTFFERRLQIVGPKVGAYDSGVQGITVHPEGGNLVVGIANKLVIAGKPGTSGKITGGRSDTASFILDEHGLGLTFLTPQPGMLYQVVASETRLDLPQARQDGIGMLAHVPSNGLPIRVTLQIPATSALRAENFVLALTRHGVVYYTAGFRFQQKNYLNFLLPQDKLQPGVSQITVFGEDGKVMGERLVYVRPAAAPALQVDLEESSYNVRDEVPAAISIKDSTGRGVPSDLSVTVYRKEAQPAICPGENIVDQAFLLGAFGGSGHQMRSLSGDSTRFSTIDQYLITRKWNRYSWNDIISGERRVQRFSGFLHIAGRASRTNGDPLPDSTRITFLLQRSVMTYVTEVGPDGTFHVPLLVDFFDEEEIYYHVESRGKVLPDVTIVPDERMAFAADQRAVRHSSNDDPYFYFVSRRRNIDRSYFYQRSRRINVTPPSLNALIEEEVLGSDVTINMDDYYLFPTMSETLREIVPILQHRRNGVKLFFDDRNRFASDEPLFVIDGVITDNSTYFLSLKPADVANIKIVFSDDKLRTFGAISRNGIVMVETKIPGNSLQVPRSRQTFKALGLRRPSVSHQRLSYERQQRIPDLRTNIYWNPAVKTDNAGQVKISIPVSDVPGTYVVRVEGFTTNREPVSAETSFDVVFVD